MTEPSFVVLYDFFRKNILWTESWIRIKIALNMYNVQLCYCGKGVASHKNIFSGRECSLLAYTVRHIVEHCREAGLFFILRFLTIQ